MALAWITGANGLIGNYILRTSALYAKGWDARGITRPDFDLCEFEAVKRAFTEQKPQLVIHCAALSKSPACQANPLLARKVNIEVTKHLAGLAENIPFLFFSTDLVFDGRAGNYDEAAAVNPLSVYAETKVAAEEFVLGNPNHTVIRTSLNGGTSPTGDRGFNEEMRRAWQAGKTLNLFTDELRSPIPAIITARAVWELVSAQKPGLYHIAGSERMSRWQIGEVMAARWPHLHPKIQPGSLRDYQGAPRAPDASLNCAKAQALLSFPLPGLNDWLAAYPDEAF
ncbi:SDR family oxidoreductase [Pedosphaera parvula]|uniref:dTDP-4-dehydrorhamnose reductase n=1 Tax=Pedosphaera parvula (strain Ellin514) TaxID=320771 RepID=B9XJ08_PEDPL|nr:SDR family oxidoreductase [Pedosphaera parvula]EEF60235.1 dTDP-4-dehydrorhamnose reductase [Pedosphaera parvula Ellin514]